MKKNIFAFFLVLSVFPIALCALTPPVKLIKKPPLLLPKTTPTASVSELPTAIHMIDNFEDGNIESNPEWWAFGDLNISVTDNYPTPETPFIGSKSMRLQGHTKEWYIGGCGAYLGLDASPYTAIRLVVLGQGEKSGTMVIELYDDDNDNWEIETYPRSDVLKFDDKFTYTLNVDWTGWKVITIPLKDFIDANPMVGNDKWDPVQTGSSGGLIQMQFLVLSREKKGKVDLRLDSVSLITISNPQGPHEENKLDYPPVQYSPDSFNSF